MNKIKALDDNERFIKFNTQRLMELERSDYDYEFLAGILNIKAEKTKQIIDGFESSLKTACEDISTKYVSDDFFNRSCTKLAFIGDSITSEREGFFNIIRRFFQARGDIVFYDAALSAAKIADANDHLYLRVISKKPDIAHILIGTNDVRKHNVSYAKNNVSIHEYKNSLDYMMHILSDHQIRIIVSLLPLANNQGIDIEFGGRNWIYDCGDIEKYNDVIREVAYRYKALINEWQKDISDPKEYLAPDGIHLNLKGSIQLAKGILDCFKKINFD